MKCVTSSHMGSWIRVWRFSTSATVVGMQSPEGKNNLEKSFLLER